jgi:hypothetical protein
VSNLSVVPLFATPFGVVSLPEAQHLNSAVSATLQRHAASDASPLPECTPLYYRSRESEHFGDASVQSLVTHALSGMNRVILAVNAFGEQQLKTWTVQRRVSFAIVESDGGVAPRNFPMTSWCGIYCVGFPSLPADRQDSGVLRLYESRLGHVFSDATTAAMTIPYANGHYAWRPVPGQLAVFPGSVTHGIATNRGSGRLILITLRLRIVAPGQEGWSLW